jgi:phosphate transport system permease protein
MSLRIRIIINFTVLSISALAAAGALGVLIWILTDVALKGGRAINWKFFTELPTPPGTEGGGVANAIAGTALMTFAAAVMAVPFGIMAGTYIAEFGNNRFGRGVRFISEIMVSAPSVVTGIFVYLIIVKPSGHFSGWAGAVSLALIMLPVVSLTTEEMLRLTGRELRESALALGAPYWSVMLKVIFRAAGPGIATGVMLAAARVAGETAPLLFTALNSPYWMNGLSEPTANLTVLLFNYAMSPYEDWHTKAWGAALLITFTVLILNITTRIVLSRVKRK